MPDRSRRPSAHRKQGSSCPPPAGARIRSRLSRACTRQCRTRRLTALSRVGWLMERIAGSRFRPGNLGSPCRLICPATDLRAQPHRTGEMNPARLRRGRDPVGLALRWTATGSSRRRFCFVDRSAGSTCLIVPLSLDRSLATGVWNNERRPWTHFGSAYPRSQNFCWP